VYFITSIIGWANLAIAYIFDKKYYPLRSYFIIFENNEIVNLKKITNSILHFSGYRAHIISSIPYKVINELFYIMLAIILIALFFAGYKLVQSNEISQPEIIKWTVIFSFLMAIAIPWHSSDLYGYIARGAQQSLYHQNPYLSTVDAIHGHKLNSLFFNCIWADTPTTYGPIFVYLTKAIVYLSNNSFLYSFINFKLLNLTVFLFFIWLLTLLKDTKNIYLIGWNPLILIQGLWNCHNDLLSGVLIFVSLYLFAKDKNNCFLGMFFLIIAAGVKFVSLLLIPIICFHYLFKEKFKWSTLVNLSLGLLAGVMFILLFSLDYMVPIEQLLNGSLNKIVSNVGLVHKSLIALIFTVIKYCCEFLNLNCDLGFIQNFVRCFIYLGFVLFYFFVLLKKQSDIVFNSILVLFVFFAFTIAKFHSWYLLNLIVLLPLLNDLLLKRILITLSMSHTFAITFLDQAKILNFIAFTLIPTLLVVIKGKHKVE